MLKTSERAWSPYVTGIIIGLLVIPALIFTDTAPNPSEGFLTVAGKLVTLVSPSAPHPDLDMRHPEGGQGWWQTAFLIGIALGAALSATLAKTKRRGPSPVWAIVLGTSAPRVRAIAAFAGGFLMLLGAALAGGDFIGHGLSGVAQLAVSSLITLCALTIGGLAAGRLLRPLRDRGLKPFDGDNGAL